MNGRQVGARQHRSAHVTTDGFRWPAAPPGLAGMDPMPPVLLPYERVVIETGGIILKIHFNLFTYFLMYFMFSAILEPKTILKLLAYIFKNFSVVWKVLFLEKAGLIKDKF